MTWQLRLHQFIYEQTQSQVFYMYLSALTYKISNSIKEIGKISATQCQLISIEDDLNIQFL